MNKVTDFFGRLMNASDPTSMMRFLALIVIFNVLIIWSTACFWEKKILDIPQGIIEMIGIVVLGKALQTFGETRTAVEK